MEAVIIIISIIIGIGILFFVLRMFVSKVFHNNPLYLARLLVGLLVLQFILGMLSNLFVQIPKEKPYIIYQQLNSVPFHAFNGLFLVLLSGIFNMLLKKNNRSLFLPMVGSTSIFVAFLSGFTFVATQNDILSFTMSLGFVAAFLTYTFFAFSLPNHQD